MINNIICSPQWLNVPLIVQNSFTPHDPSAALPLYASSVATRKIHLAPPGNWTRTFAVEARRHNHYAAGNWRVFQTHYFKSQLVLHKPFSMLSPPTRLQITHSQSSKRQNYTFCLCPHWLFTKGSQYQSWWVPPPRKRSRIAKWESALLSVFDSSG